MGMQATTTRLTYARNQYIKQGRSHIFDRVGDMIYYATLGGRLEEFFIDGAYGADTNDAKTIAGARKTLTSALGLVTDNKQDYVFLRNYGNQSGEDYPIAGDTWKKRAHIVGLEPYGGRYELIDSASTSKSAVDFTTNDAAGTSFEHIAFASSGSSTVPAVDFSATCWYITFRNCAFGWSGETARYGIYSASAVDTPHLVIDGCTFWGDSINVAAIELLGSSTRAQIKNCKFIGILTGDYAITDTGGTGLMNVLIENNTFSIHTESAAGQAIYLTGAGHCSVNGNVAYQGNSTMTYNPYRDTGTNDWGLNYAGGVAVSPAII